MLPARGAHVAVQGDHLGAYPNLPRVATRPSKLAIGGEWTRLPGAVQEQMGIITVSVLLGFGVRLLYTMGMDRQG